jgi:hypothetical protein
VGGAGWSWVEYYGRLQDGPVAPVEPEYPTQDCSGILPNGTPCAHPEDAQHADACLPALWADPRPRPQRSRSDPAAWAGGGQGGGTLAAGEE